MYSLNKIKILILLLVGSITLAAGGFLVFSKIKGKENKESTNSLALLDISTLDSDQDGLSDKKEIELGTNPYSYDSDSDGFSDLEEVKSGHNPLKVESYKLIDEDGDGLTGEDEDKYGTNPKNPDTDYDGYPDGIEVITGNDPLKANLSKLANLTPVPSKEQKDNKKEMSCTNCGKSKDSSLSISPRSYTATVGALENTLSAQNSQDFESSLRNFIGLTSGKSFSNTDASLSRPTIPDEWIKKMDKADAKTVQAYINSMGISLFKLAPFKDEESFQDYASSINLQDKRDLEEIEKLLNQSFSTLKEMKVPNDPQVINFHKKILSTNLAAQEIASSLKKINYQSPQSLYTLLNRFKQQKALIDIISNEIIPEARAISEKYGFEIPDYSFFQKVAK